MVAEPAHSACFTAGAVAAAWRGPADRTAPRSCARRSARWNGRLPNATRQTAGRRRRQSWWIYLIRRGDGALYAGIAIDVAARLRLHEAGRGAKALRGRGPLALVWHRRIGDRGMAQRVEARLKRLGKAGKERLVAEPAAARRWLRGVLRPAATAPMRMAPRP